jgi:hypothetical protein
MVIRNLSYAAEGGGWELRVRRLSAQPTTKAVA